MRLTDRQFDLTALTALIAITPHVGRLPWWLSIPLVAIMPLRILGRRRGALRLHTWLRVPLVVLLLAVIVMHYGNIFGRDAGNALAVGLLMLKLLETDTVRDARAALGFSAFVMMSALLFTQTLLFTFLQCVSLVVLLASLNALEPASLSQQHPLRRGLRVGAALLGLGLPLALTAFVLIPRLSSPLWGAPGLDKQARTGLSDRMTPGELTELLTDDSPALRARFRDAPPMPAARYFRALVLSDFDGSSWTRSPGTFGAAMETLEATNTPLDYDITLEPTDRPWLVALDMPVSASPGIRIQPDRSLIAPARVAQPLQYQVRSATSYRLAGELDAGSRERNLRLPQGFNPRSHALVQKWRLQGRSDEQMIDAALANFNASFSYTLTPPLLGRNSVDDFLFETQRGYCEHYSSSFTFLMRAAGIPARVVIGYQGGWWQPMGSYLLVRNSDAHAWSEVWLEGRGWIRVDPTAAVSPARIELGAPAVNRGEEWFAGDWLLGMRNRLDVMNRMWTQTIVQFNALRQKSLLTPLGIDQAEPADLLLALAIIIAVLLLAATLWVLRAPTPSPGDELDQAWRALLGKLGRHGIEIRPQEGPLDFQQRAGAQLTEASMQRKFIDLADTYTELRYGHASTAEVMDVAQFVRDVARFRLPPRRSRTP